jgi:hypothetical protein
MKRLACFFVVAWGLSAAATAAHGQSLEDLELKKAEKQKARAKAEKKAEPTKKLTKKVEVEKKSDFDFGFLGIAETASSINRDRPSVYTLLWLAPQLKYKQIYRLQINMGFYGYYLDRDPNPWDLTDWSLQLSALRLYKEKHTGIALSGNLRYYMPTSVKSRNNGSEGALRALIKLTRTYWKLYFGLELMAYYYFSRYTTADPERWWDPTYIDSNPQATLAQRAIVSYTPIKKLTFSFLWTWYQTQDYAPSEAYDGVGSSLVTDSPRKNDLWDYSWSCILDVTYNVWKWFFIAGGYSIYAPALQNGGHDVSYNPFNPKYAQVYLDLMMIY